MFWDSISASHQSTCNMFYMAGGTSEPCLNTTMWQVFFDVFPNMCSMAMCKKWWSSLYGLPETNVWNTLHLISTVYTYVCVCVCVCVCGYMYVYVRICVCTYMYSIIMCMCMNSNCIHSRLPYKNLMGTSAAIYFANIEVVKIACVHTQNGTLFTDRLNRHSRFTRLWPCMPK